MLEVLNEHAEGHPPGRFRRLHGGPSVRLDPLTGELTVNSSTGGNRYNPSLAYDSNNKLWIAWESTQSGNSDIYFRRFGSGGHALGHEILVNQYTAGNQNLAQLATGSNGKVAVSWTSLDDSGDGVSARIFNSDGSPATA